MRHLQGLIGLLIAAATLSPILVNGQATGSISVQSVPTGEVLVAGRSIGRTPLIVTVNSGVDVAVAIRAPGYETWEQHVRVAPGEESSLTAELMPANGTLRIIGLPAGSSLQVNGVKIDHSLAETPIRGPGVAVAVRLAGGRKVRATVSAEQGAPTILHFSRSGWNPRVLGRSALLPGWGQLHVRGMNAESAIIVTGLIASGIGLAVSHLRYLDADAAYHESFRAYLDAQGEKETAAMRDAMLAQYEKAASVHRTRLGFIRAAAGVYVLNLLDAAIHHGAGVKLNPVRTSGETSLQPMLDLYAGSAAVGVRIQF